MYLVVFIILLMVAYGSSQSTETCSGDVTFIMETSVYMGTQWVNRTTDAILAIAKELNIDENGNHVSLVHFASPDDRTGVLMNGNKYFFSSFVDFERALNGMKYIDVVGTSNTYRGLSLAHKVLTSDQSRPNSTNVAILFSRGEYDHCSPCCPDPTVNALKLRAIAAMFGVVIPVPSSYSLSEMFQLIGAPDRVFNWTSEAKRLVYEVNDVINNCKKTTSTTTPSTTLISKSTVAPTSVILPECQKQDILFILDASESIGKVNFNRMKRFIMKITDQFFLGPESARFAIIRFNREGSISFHLNTFDNRIDLDNAIWCLQWLDGINNIADGLEKAKTVYTTVNGMRKDAQNTIILVTDGVHTKGFAGPIDPARDLRTNYGARIISVGVSGVNGELEESHFSELVGISGDADLVVKVSAWDNLNSVEVFKNMMDLFKWSCKHPIPYTSKTPSQKTDADTTIVHTMPTSSSTVTTWTSTTCKYDIAVLIDNSGTMKNSMDMEKEFLIQLFHPSHGIKIDQTLGTRLGVVSVSSSATLLKGLGGIENYDQLKALINSIKNYGLIGYNLSEAFGNQGATAEIGMFGTSADRPNFPDIAVVFVAEIPTDLDAAKIAARLLKSTTNAKIILVFAPGVDKNLFSAIPSDAQFQLPNWETNTISSLATEVASKMCTLTQCSVG